ncbi:MAG TPA: hypothetical protein VMT26_05920 [Candidatus Bathyarchaeia archaeon]|jgi:hypothetical protein|nr:hypothetical protein [Candidatus Bathyarchaeia archaeon]
MRKESKLNKKIRSREVKVDAKATRTLRTLSDEEAFHFYEDIGKPTGESARSLRDFLERIESVKLESLVFHLKRNDFKNWVENTLEDPKLGKKLEKIPVTHNNRLRAEVRSVVRDRLKELEATSDLAIFCVGEPATITA